MRTEGYATCCVAMRRPYVRTSPSFERLQKRWMPAAREPDSAVLYLDVLVYDDTSKGSSAKPLGDSKKKKHYLLRSG